MGAGIEHIKLPPEARRLDTVPISEHVYRALRDAICEDVFEPYARLVQNEIAEQLGVSRTPVRDALLRLSQEGLVDAVGARGYVVRPLTPRDILDVYEVRQVLETLAVDLAFDFITEGDVVEMCRLQEEIAHPEAHEADYYDINQRFHSVMLQRCPNQVLQRVIGELWDLPVSRRIFRQYVNTGVSIPTVIEEHQAIVEAAQDRDRERLISTIGKHVSNARDDSATWLERNE